MASFEKINYSLRPGKSIERKLIVEILMRLGVLHSLPQYQYVGMGSTFFSDFRLIHRMLGIKRLISMESEVTKQERFDFNRPYDCIEMMYGEARHQLPEIELELPSIVWLDYDQKLRREMFEDLEIVAERVPHGSVLGVTVNAQPGDEGTRLEGFDERLGADMRPETVTRDEHLAGYRTGDVYVRLLDDWVRRVVAERNLSLAPDDKLDLFPLFHFRYRDGAPMLTYGWLFHSSPVAEIRELFDDLPQVPSSEEPYDIEVPSLTFKEMRHLDESLPVAGNDEMTFIPAEDRDKYRRVYRHFPNYAEVEVG